MCWNLNPANLSLERSLVFFVTTQPISATEEDFTGVAGIVTLMPAVPSNLELCVNIDIKEDVVVESQERFMLILNSMDPAVTFIPTLSTIQVSIDTCLCDCQRWNTIPRVSLIESFSTRIWPTKSLSSCAR